MRNTRLLYTYKDQAGRKKSHQVVFSGVISDGDRDAIMKSLHLGSQFIPSQVGMSPLYGNSEDDQVWHRLDASDISLTFEHPNMGINIRELADRFAETVWDPQLETVNLFAPEEMKHKVSKKISVFQ